MNTLLVQAIKKAGQIRKKLRLNIFEPVNVFDACAELGLTVRFIDVSMEGMYINQGTDPASQAILISSLRPMPRRVYTCAHELGHHIFGHGSKIDGLTKEGIKSSLYDNDEYLVDAFAGAFLMPIAGIEAEFIKRKWEPPTSSSMQFYTISSIFGTGYSTLITHCQANRLISESRAITLMKQKPAKMLQHLMGTIAENSHFKIIDYNTELSVVDLEVGNYLILPADTSTEGVHLRKLKNTDYGDVFVAEHPGIVRAVSVANGTGYFIRIQNARYIGLAENRHLEDKIDLSYEQISFLIENMNLSEAWITALKKITDSGGSEISPLVVTLTDFTEVRDVRKALNIDLSTHKLPSIETVSETIFPESLYEYVKYDREELYKSYKRNLPRIKKIDSSNVNGTYFERMIAFDSNKQINQLEIIISSLIDVTIKRRSKLQASIFDPTKDHTNRPFQGFPCLQHVTFYKSENGGLVLNSFYAIQYLYRRAYGNWLGLINLGKFVSRETGLDFERLNCFIGIEHLDHLKKQEGKKLLADLNAFVLAES